MKCFKLVNSSLECVISGIENFESNLVFISLGLVVYSMEHVLPMET